MSTQLPAILAENEDAKRLAEVAVDWQETAKSYKIASPEMAEAAAEDLRTIKGHQKAVEDLRKKLKQPSLDEGKAIDGFFKKPKDFLSKAEKLLKDAILTFQREEEAKRLAAANDNQPLDEDDFEAPAVQAEPTKLDGISSRSTWKAEVTDKMALVKAVAAGDAPLDALLVNQSHLDAMARSLREAMKVPGVKPYEEKTLAVR